jgi:hypothetical protein
MSDTEATHFGRVISRRVGHGFWTAAGLPVARLSARARLVRASRRATQRRVLLSESALEFIADGAENTRHRGTLSLALKSVIRCRARGDIFLILI